MAAALEIVAAAARPSDVIIGSGEKFKQGFQNKEFPLQAKFINDLTRDGSAVCTRLGVNKLYFVASELILQEVETSGGDKIDVVAADEKGNVFFFEMKSEQNKKDNPVAQVARYIERYGKNGHRNDEFEKLLRNYPIHSVSKIDKYSGIVVIGDENGYEIRPLEKIDE
ncbi:MAG: hypothetical protein LBG12_04840 [Synergistaceae bacterium]|nr:hypothetical protein [Synergistaceae bacterium]